MSIAADMIDKRVVRRYLERGDVDSAAFQSHLEQLPDCAGKCVQATPETDDDDDEADVDADEGMSAQASAP